MAARVNDEEVKVLIDTNRDTSPFIDDANLIVNENLVGKGFSDERLKLIEKYLAAHLVALTEERGGLTRYKNGDSSEEYQLVKGSGIAQTRYGQQAIMLDTTGTLQNLSRAGGTAEFRVV